MKKTNENIEVIKLSTKEILLSFQDSVLFLDAVFSKRKKDKTNDEYFEKRAIDRKDFAHKIYRLRTRGFIKKIVKGKDYFLELTDNGIKRRESITLNNFSPRIEDTWDKKWRIVMFDIPEKEKGLRNVIREKLYMLGFQQVQKSIFVYPFDVHSEITLIYKHYGGSNYIKYMIADIIEGEEEFIELFIEKQILTKRQLSL